MLDFVALDFETANSYRGSPCSIGLARVRGGQVVGRQHWLIRPPVGADWFDRWNVAIHGIKPQMVKSEPRWAERLPEILEFIGNDVVVAHNAGFDIGVIRYACAIDNIEWPEVRFLCTMILARRALPLASYRLPFVVESLGGALDNHHDALADALAVVDVVNALAQIQGASNLEALAASAGMTIGQMRGGQYTGSVAISGSSNGELVRADVDPSADRDGYLYGRVVVFTGKLMSMTRQIAWNECSRVGAIAESATTRRTQVLVVGDINPAVLRPGSTVTGKARKAFELQDGGQEIEVMTEDDFIRCLDGQPIDIAEVLNVDGIDEIPLVPVPRDTRLRSIPIEQRPPEPTPVGARELLPPKPLRRAGATTDQECAKDGCTSVAAFKTRSRPTWCEYHIDAMYRAGGLRRLESFSHPDDWILTECRTCAVQCHYRLVYVIEKNSWGELTCRACYWSEWALASRRLAGSTDSTELPFEDARAHVEANGFDYLGPLTEPSLRNDPHHTQCRRCGKLGAARLGDISFGCTCIPRK